MKTFRYDTSGKWFKGNTHIHSVKSDGGKTVDELTAMYASRGYDFLFATDHWVASDHRERNERDDRLLWLDGIELDGADQFGLPYHVVCLGRCEADRSKGFIGMMQSAREQGCLLVLAHPLWCGNNVDDTTRWGFHGVEIYNHVCRWLNGKSDGLTYWSAMLAKNPDTLAFAADDAHIRKEHPGWDGGWIVVNAPRLGERELLSAIKSGNYYSSTGPSINSLTLEGDTLAVTTSPVTFMRLVGPGSLGARLGSFDGVEMTKGVFTIPPDWPYAYLEIEDAESRRAWTNTLLTS